MTPVSLLTKTEAIQRLGTDGEQLLRRLITEGRLATFRFADESLGWSATDLDALQRPVPQAEALAELEGAGTQPPVPPAPSLMPPDLLRQIQALLSSHRHQAPKDVRWIDAADVEAQFSVDRRRLRSWVARGLIKQAKLGSSKQAKSLYSVEDLDRVLTLIAEGKLQADERTAP